MTMLGMRRVTSHRKNSPRRRVQTIRGARSHQTTQTTQMVTSDQRIQLLGHNTGGRSSERAVVGNVRVYSPVSRWGTHARNVVRPSVMSPIRSIIETLPQGAPRRLLVWSYAVMRVVDDAVDEGYGLLPAARRRRARGRMLAVLSQWQAVLRRLPDGHDGHPQRLQPSALVSARKGFDGARLPMIPAGLWLQRSRGGMRGRSRHGFVVPSALFPIKDDWHHLCARAFHLPFFPVWDVFFKAMRDDIQSPALRSWRCWDRYVEGASVAPAWLLIAMVSSQLPPLDDVRKIAAACYLGHIARDSARDGALSWDRVRVPSPLVTRVMRATGGALSTRARRVVSARVLPRWLIGDARRRWGDVAHGSLHRIVAAISSPLCDQITDMIASYTLQSRGHGLFYR